MTLLADSAGNGPVPQGSMVFPKPSNRPAQSEERYRLPVEAVEDSSRLGLEAVPQNLRRKKQVAGHFQRALFRGSSVRVT